MKKYLLLMWIVGFMAALPPAAEAQTLDATPNLTSVNRPAEVNAAIQQADGKHVLVGYFTSADGALSRGLVRYNANHTPDQAFNANASALSTVGALENVRQLPSGKLLLIGYDTIRSGTVVRRRLLRLNTDGTPDASFDAGSALPATTYQQITSAVQPDGKILIGCIALTSPTTTSHRVLRLLPDGSLDPSFNFTVALNGAIKELTLQPDGKILVGGVFSTPRRILRLLPDGSVDNTFSSGLANNGSPSLGVSQIGLQPDGKIIIAGVQLYVSSGVARAVVRLQANGALDNTFNSAALTNTPTNYFDANEITVLADGSIVLCGYRSSTPGSTGGFICLDATGSPSNFLNDVLAPDEAAGGLNTLFHQANGQWLVGANGALLTSQRSYVALLNADGTHDASFNPTLLADGYFNDMALQSDGKLVVGGEFDEISGVRVKNLARLNADGSVDAAFSSQSKAANFVTKVGLTPSGQVLAASVIGLALQRFTSAGAPDRTFQLDQTIANQGITQLAVQPDGRVLVFSGLYTLYRLLANGQLDGSFTAFQDVSLTLDMVLQPDGKLLIGGNYDYDQQLNAYTNSVLRLLANGQRDATFTPLPKSRNFVVGKLALQSTGKIVVGAGYAAAGVGRVIRLLPNGLPDAGFTPLSAPRTNDGVTALAVQPNDRILLSARDYRSGSSDLRRLLVDGQADNSFASVPLAGDGITILTQPDGKLVLNGYFQMAGGVPRINLVRLTAGNVLRVAANQTLARTQAWPNPVRHVLNLELDAAARPQRVTLLDAAGKVVKQQAATAAMRLDVSPLPAGLYLLRVDYASGPVTRRVVVE